MTELKPCPFCGKEPRLQVWQERNVSKDAGAVMCVNEACEVQPKTWFKDIDKAVEIWNKRETVEVSTIQTRRGKWLDFHVTEEGIAEELCSRCEEWTIGRNKRYCPNCGTNNRPLVGGTNVET